MFPPSQGGSQKFLRLAVKIRGEMFHLQFQALPFGLSSSPPHLYKSHDGDPGLFVTQRHFRDAHLDNLLLFSPSPEQLVQDLQVARSLLENLGWLLNLEKSNLIPSQRVPFLGYILDSPQRKVFLPQEKIQKSGQAKVVVAGQSPGLDKTGHVIPRLAEGCLPCSAVGRPTLSPFAAFHPRGRGPQSKVLGLTNTSTKTGKEVCVFVEEDDKLFSWSGVGSAGFQDHYDRCKWHWLGSAPRSAAGAGFLESRGCKEILELDWPSEPSSRSSRDNTYRSTRTTPWRLPISTNRGGTRGCSLWVLVEAIFKWAKGTALSLSAVHLKGRLNQLLTSSAGRY